MIGALVVHLLRAQRVGNHQDLESVERLFSERLATAHHVIPVVADQIGEWLVATCGSIEVVVPFIKKYARETLCERGMLDRSLEVRVGALLGASSHREHEQQSAALRECGESEQSS